MFIANYKCFHHNYLSVENNRIKHREVLICGKWKNEMAKDAENCTFCNARGYLVVVALLMELKLLPFFYENK